MIMMRQGVLRRMSVAVKIVDANTIVCRTPLIWRALSEASETSSSTLLRSSWVFNVSISFNGGHDVSHVNGSDVTNFKCADTPLQYGLSMRESDSWYRSTILCGHFRYVPMWQVNHLVSVDLSCVYDSVRGLCIHIHAALSCTSSWLHKHARACTRMHALTLTLVPYQMRLLSLRAMRGFFWVTVFFVQATSFGPESGGSTTTVTGINFVANADPRAACRFWDDERSPLLVGESNRLLLASLPIPAMLTCATPTVQVPRPETLMRDEALGLCLVQRPYDPACPPSGTLLLPCYIWFPPEPHETSLCA